MNILIKGAELGSATAAEIGQVLAHTHRAFAGAEVIFQEAEAKVEAAAAAVDTVPAHIHAELRETVVRIEAEAHAVVNSFREGWAKVAGALGLGDDAHPDEVVAAIKERTYVQPAGDADAGAAQEQAGKPADEAGKAE